MDNRFINVTHKLWDEREEKEKLQKLLIEINRLVYQITVAHEKGHNKVLSNRIELLNEVMETHNKGAK